MCALVRTLAIVIPLTVAACSSGGGGVKATSTYPGADGAGTTEAAVTGSAPSEMRVFVRRCDTSVYGRLDSRGWRQHSIIAGPLVIYYADQFARQEGSYFEPIGGEDDHYAGQKLLLLVRRGAVATVVVPESERRYVALLYNPAAWNDRNAYRIDDGESAVTFKACKKGETAPVGGPPNAMTQFNGGFVVAGARCAGLDVRVRGQQRAIPVTLSFGAGRCR
jgi:hypothetical protein